MDPATGITGGGNLTSLKNKAMITQNEGENRKEYLARVTIWLLLNTAACGYVANYDEATCDGYCLADDIANEYGFDTEEIQAL